MVKFVTSAIGAIWWSNLEPMQVAPSGGQLCDYCEWFHQVANFATRASGVIWWPNMKVITSHDQIWNCNLNLVKHFNKDDFWNFSGKSFYCAAKYVCKILQLHGNSMATAAQFEWKWECESEKVKVRKWEGEFGTNASGAIWWSKLQLMQVVPSGSQIFNLCQWC